MHNLHIRKSKEIEQDASFDLETRNIIQVPNFGNAHLN